MNDEAVWTPAAIDDLVALAGRDRKQAQRVTVAIRGYLREGRGDVKKLVNQEGEWRLRVGDWRVIFNVDDTGTVHIGRIRLRADAYE